ncbi:MAG: ATP-binding protein [Desulfobacteraceae bacterium]|nr:ATP-binding protein [Desulfobacteraceae bacterium]MBC2755665.1 ATP-binding protein [Desulfobacteraceae bacterium]
MYKRTLGLTALLKKKSFFLFGPRGTGKTTLIKHTLSNATVIDLLESKTYRNYLRNPSILSDQKLKPIVVIDEIQKLPELLDEVHRLIESERLTFLLTGSSSRKLKRGGANLLAGRAWWAELFPLTSYEIPDFDLLTYLNRGGLPVVYPSDEYVEELRAYTSLYLREEIQNEALTRKIVQFSEFLELIALSNGEEISFQSIAGDCGVSPNSIKNYIQILEDTLLAFPLKPFTKTKRRKAISRSKLYFFDIGVTNSLANRGEILEGSELFGKAFEHFILLEVRAFLSYARKNIKMFYWRSTSRFEVDLILGDKWAIEIKSSKLIYGKHLKGIRALKEEGNIQNFAVISCDQNERTTQDDIVIFPWKVFLDKLWKGEII